ncbi:MAG: hypothetical protein GEV05_00130 [Betaproteobacteria bacterium]|nr:hypothetical protein [Betaproteobacteria bacterium]
MMFWSSLALAAFAQSIKLPDLRSPPPSMVTLKPGEPCNACGRVVSIREVQLDQRSSVPPAFHGSPGSSSGSVDRNLVGAVIYLPLGGATRERPFVGGVGTPEAQARFRQSSYEILVRLDDGTLRTTQRHDGSRYSVGDRVRLAGNDEIELIAR